MEYDVVVAGAGPVGLMLACELRLAGVSVLVVERLAAPDRALKAGAMGARSLNVPTTEAFRRRGVLQAVKEAAIWWYAPESAPEPAPPQRNPPAPMASPQPVFAGHFAGIPVRADLLDQSDPDLARPGRSAGVGVISQYDLEMLLCARAGQLGVDPRRGAELTALAADDGGVTVQVAGQQIRTGWLVGCDGGRSTVRKLAGFDFPGTDAQFIGRQAMVELADPEQLPIGDWVRTAGGSYVHGPVPGRIHTVEYTQLPVPRDTPVTAEELQASLRRVSGRDLTITAVHAATRYTDATRQTSTYRRGRVLLAGDAAHIHSPAGGQGLNLGIGDALNLGWKLAATAQGWAPDGLLDSYTAERHPIGAWVQNWSKAQTALGRPDAHTRALRDVVGDLLGTVAGTTYVLKQLSGVWQRYDLPGDHPLIGRSAPDLTLDDGSSLSERCHAGRALLFDLADDAALRQLAEGWDQRVTVIAGRCAALPALSGLFVRPDGSVAWAADGPANLEALDAALHTWLGAPTVL